MWLGGREQSWRQIGPTIRLQHVEPQDFPGGFGSWRDADHPDHPSIGLRRPQRAALARVVRRERPQFRQLAVDEGDDAGVFAPAGSDHRDEPITIGVAPGTDDRTPLTLSSCWRGNLPGTGP